MKLKLKPNTAIVSVLENINLYDLLFEGDENDRPKIVGLHNNKLYSKIEILEITEQSDNDKSYKQLEVDGGDICIIATSMISVVNEEADIKLGFIDTQNIIAKIYE